MRVTVIGGRGQVARALAGRSSSSFAVVLIGRPTIDLATCHDLVPTVAATRPDVIVNAAAYTDVEGAEREPEAAGAVNAAGAAQVAAAAAALGVPLIHLSTDYVYDGAKDSPYVETDATAPLNEYGRSKLAGERLAASATPDCTILRTSWVYAPFGRNFVTTMLRLLSAHSEVKVIADRFGAPTSALDIAKGIEQIARNLLSARGHASGVFHMTAAGAASWAQFAEAIFACAYARNGRTASVVPISWRDYPETASRPCNSRLDNALLARTHGVALPHWRPALEEVMARIDGAPS
jgi:dTDP-4-dehydrorhamnose reductase